MAIFLVTAPSGTGKTTIMDCVVEHLFPRGTVSECISHTTRKIRKEAGEVDGETYYYVDSKKFGDMIEDEEFAECVRYAGHSYGITIDEIKRVQEKSRHVYIILNYDGYKQVKQVFPKAVGIFLHMSKEDCMANMLLRKDSMENALERIALYDEEIKNRHDFDYVVKNVRNRLPYTAQVIQSIMRQYE
ncbi:guanylate kinase [Bacillus phage vB_BanS_Chewbecca]|uniref:Guanylate kinase n=1 Tax=Bacillus phage vB_BanS_Chewbecca TaxID=2894786 RepID=A0AAE8YMI5_9CAUD|nr:guanylate kinase [Bacillus phage vB_BanS_Chewbecca]UGO46206.1 putative guanylate kinase [Bacillus phage vB_BanS_Chewbecca]